MDKGNKLLEKDRGFSAQQNSLLSPTSKVVLQLNLLSTTNNHDKPDHANVELTPGPFSRIQNALNRIFRGKEDNKISTHYQSKEESSYQSNKIIQTRWSFKSPLKKTTQSRFINELPSDTSVLPIYEDSNVEEKEMNYYAHQDNLPALEVSTVQDIENVAPQNYHPTSNKSLDPDRTILKELNLEDYIDPLDYEGKKIDRRPPFNMHVDKRRRGGKETPSSAKIPASGRKLFIKKTPTAIKPPDVNKPSVQQVNTKSISESNPMEQQNDHSMKDHKSTSSTYLDIPIPSQISKYKPGHDGSPRLSTSLNQIKPEPLESPFFSSSNLHSANDSGHIISINKKFHNDSQNVDDEDEDNNEDSLFKCEWENNATKLAAW